MATVSELGGTAINAWGRSYSTGCLVSEEDGQTAGQIKQGFSYERSIEKLYQLYLNLFGDDPKESV